MNLTARLARERTIGVLFTEHDMDVVFGHADRVLVLNRGMLIAAGRAVGGAGQRGGPGGLSRRRRALRSQAVTAAPFKLAVSGSTPPTARRASCSTSR